MRETINITEAREKFLQLPEKMSPGEEIKVKRNKKVVLFVRRAHETDEQKPDAVSILNKALENMAKFPKPRNRPPKDLALNYKHYLYGKKKH